MKFVRGDFAFGEKVRILVVDDSVIMRRMISRIFDGDASVQVVGTACDGLDALEKIQQLKPHVVTLDVEMPKLDGMAALRKIAESYPDVRVVMLSSLTEQGAKTTIDALMQGASDYVAKPASAVGPAFDRLATELLFKVKQFFPRSAGAIAAEPPGPASAPVTLPFATVRRKAAEVCAIGVSTGGPSALLEVLPMIPADVPMPILIVQHMPAMFTHLLAERLNGVCRVPVAEGRDGMILSCGQIVIAPGGFHMQVAQSGAGLVLRLDEGPKENSCRPAVDVLFRSIAEHCSGHAIAAILTGMGQDGLAGARLLKARGATILAQDQASSVVWGMPGAVVAANLADAVVPLQRIVPEILTRAGAR